MRPPSDVLRWLVCHTVEAWRTSVRWLRWFHELTRPAEFVDVQDRDRRRRLCIDDDNDDRTPRWENTRWPL